MDTISIYDNQYYYVELNNASSQSLTITSIELGKVVNQIVAPQTFLRGVNVSQLTTSNGTIAKFAICHIGPDKSLPTANFVKLCVDVSPVHNGLIFIIAATNRTTVEVRVLDI